MIEYHSSLRADSRTFWRKRLLHAPDEFPPQHADWRSCCAGQRSNLFDDPQFLSHLCKCFQSLAQIIAIMGSGDHHPDSSLPLRDGRKSDRHSEDTILEELAAELLSQRRLSEHDRCDRGFTHSGVKTKLFHF